MSQEDEELLRAVREWRPPTKLHPIAMHATGIYERSGMDLPPEAIQELRKVLDAYGDDLQALAEAMEGLTRFMIVLTDHLGDQANSKKMLDLLREYTKRFQPFWERVGEALENVGSETLELFQKFTDEAAKTAAAIDDPPPEGSVPLSTLAPPGRPPPWARKKGPGPK